MIECLFATIGLRSVPRRPVPSSVPGVGVYRHDRGAVWLYCALQWLLSNRHHVPSTTPRNWHRAADARDQRGK